MKSAQSEIADNMQVEGGECSSLARQCHLVCTSVAHRKFDSQLHLWTFSTGTNLRKLVLSSQIKKTETWEHLLRMIICELPSLRLKDGPAAMISYLFYIRVALRMKGGEPLATLPKMYCQAAVSIAVRHLRRRSWNSSEPQIWPLII